MSDSTIFDVLERKGTIQIVVEIGHASKTFDQIEETVLVSSSTVSTRLKEGVDTDLFEITHRTVDHGTQKRYELTHAGKHILKLIQELDVDSTVRKYQRVTRRFEQETDNLISNATRHIQITVDEMPPGDVTSDLPPADQIPEERHEPDIDMEEMRREQLKEDLVGGIEYINEDEQNDDEDEDDEDLNS